MRARYGRRTGDDLFGEELHLLRDYLVGHAAVADLEHPAAEAARLGEFGHALDALLRRADHRPLAAHLLDVLRHAFARAVVAVRVALQGVPLPRPFLPVVPDELEVAIEVLVRPRELFLALDDAQVVRPEDLEVLRVMPRLLQLLVVQLHVAALAFVRVEQEWREHQVAAVASRPAIGLRRRQRRDVDRRHRLLQRARPDRVRIERPVLAVVDDAVLGPEPADHLPRFLEALARLLRGHAHGLEVVGRDAAPDAEVEPPAGQQVDRRPVFRAQHRVPLRDQRDGRPDADLLRAAGHRLRHDRRRGEGVARVAVLRDPDRVVAEFVGQRPLGEQPLVPLAELPVQVGVVIGDVAEAELHRGAHLSRLS